MHITDLRSDTVTKPTPAMLESMMNARVGDDVYGEDESVNELQRYCAQMFGMEDALFCPSGTMTNQVAIRVHTRPGDEILCADNAHIYKYEGGGIAANSGVQAKLVASDYGLIHASQIAQAINADDPHFPHTTLVCLENTSNRGGGSYYTLQQMQEMADVCRKHALKLHLDGARIFNAMIAGGYKASDLGLIFDSISICLSKGLGAPVGSVLLGSKSFIHQSKRVRKVFGGGMRQAGYMAACGLYALQHHINRLTEDHTHAHQAAEMLRQHPSVKSVVPVHTNIVIFQLTDEQTANRFQVYLKEKSILANKVSADSIRFVFHLDVKPPMLSRLLDAIRQFV